MMPRWTISLRAMFGVTAFCAVACAAVLRPTYLMTTSVLSLALLFLGLSIVFAICSCGHRRAFWCGFAVIGCGHMLLSISPWFEDNIGSALVTTYVLRLIAVANGHLYVQPGAYSARNLWEQFFIPQTTPGFLWDDVLISGQSILSIVLAFLGGAIASTWFCRSQLEQGRNDKASF
jgi:hypothetical protein